MLRGLNSCYMAGRVERHTGNGADMGCSCGVNGGTGRSGMISDHMARGWSSCRMDGRAGSSGMITNDMARGCCNRSHMAGRLAVNSLRVGRTSRRGRLRILRALLDPGALSLLASPRSRRLDRRSRCGFGTCRCSSRGWAVRVAVRVPKPGSGNVVIWRGRLQSRTGGADS